MSMIPMIADARPPYVRFELREYGLDQEATERESRPIPKMVAFVSVTSHGSKDAHEQVAETWLKDKRTKANRGEYDLNWIKHFELAYEEWKKGNELPREGTPIATWPMIAGQSIRQRIIASGITTVEDLAVIPDQGLGQIGMDGRYWRDTAATWVKEAKDKGSTAKELADLKSANTRLAEQNETLLDRLAAMEQRMEQLAPAKRRKQIESENLMGGS